MGNRSTIVKTGSFLCLMTLAIGAGLGACSVEPSDPGSFYTTEGMSLSGSPGDILRIEEYPDAPEGAHAWRVLYVSTGLKDEPIAVSGVVIAPERNTAPRPVVAWAHPTTGVTSRCAPSLRKDFNAHIPGLKELLAHGYVIAASDYPGLGTPGPHPYLVGLSEGRSVLDSVRAARHIAEAKASDQFAVWGHSQGGHAALFAGQIAATYAPELKLSGVATAAPATDLLALFNDDLSGKAGKIFAALAIWSWADIFNVPLAPILDNKAVAAIDRIAADCLEGPLEGLVMVELERSIDTDFLKENLTQTEPWKSLLERNAPAGRMSGAPLFIAQGTADPIVRPSVTHAYARSACSSGTPVQLMWGDGLSHLEIAPKSAPDAVQWIAGLFNGAPPPNACADLPEMPKPN